VTDGHGRCNIKKRLMKLARAKMRERESGKHWGKIKAKHLEVFEALLWGFHNCKTGLSVLEVDRL
jgi:hypothetical protein